MFLSVTVGFFGIFRQHRFYLSINIFILLLFPIILLLLRQSDASPDADPYIFMFEAIKDFDDIFNVYHRDYFFSFVQFLMIKLGIPSDQFLYLFSILVLLIMIGGYRLLTDDRRTFLLSIAFFIMTSSFVFMTTNIIRQGLALSLLMVGLGFFQKNAKRTSYLFFFATIFSHISSLAIILTLFFVRFFQRSKNINRLALLLMPFLTLISFSALEIITDNFVRIDSLASIGYTNPITYVKVFLLYSFGWIFYFLGHRYNGFENKNYYLIFSIYVLSLGIIFFFLPVLFIASRFIYYTSAMLPILFAFAVYQKRSIFPSRIRYAASYLIAISYGIFTYTYEAVTSMLVT